MEEVIFGKKNSRRYLLEKNRQLLVVRSQAGRKLDETLRCEKARQALANSELVLHIEDADVQLFKLPDNSDIPQCKALLRELPDVRFAGSALVDPHTQEPVFYTENIFLKFVDRLAPTECLVILDELGLTIKQQVPTPSMPSSYITRIVAALKSAHSHFNCSNERMSTTATRKYCARGNAERSMTTNGT
jgi:hypothetical protein